MTLSIGDYEIAAFFVCVAIFEVCERIWPARPVNRWREIKLDVLSFAFALAVNRVFSFLFRDWAGLRVTPAGLGPLVNYLQNLPSAVKILLAILMVDFIIYWIHRGQHRFDLLWRTHAWHHSIEEMYWLSGFRTSFFHSFIYAIPQAVIPVTLFKLSPAEAGIGYSIGLLIQFWEHTNLDVNIGFLKWIIITPAYHRIHHSATVQRGLNLGTTFSLWDRMFGTFVDPETMPDTFPMGLGEQVEPRKIPRMMMGV